MWLPVILLILLGGFGLGAILGAPFLPVFGRDIDKMLDLAEAHSGQTVLDLGCGDGRLLKAAAKRGMKAIGYEINPWLYVAALINCWSYRDKVHIQFGDFWRVKLPPADVIYVFLIDRYMSKLDQKLVAEVSRPTKLVSYVFTIAGRNPIKRSRNAAVYLYP